MPLAAFALSASACLFVALIEAWLLLITAKGSGAASRWIPNIKDLLKSHIDYLMMALFLFVFFGLFRLLAVVPPGWVVASACFGAFFNPAGFLVCALRPSYVVSPPGAFLAWMLLSCVATTVGFAAAGWMIAAAALTAI
ncbi:hypothetical protein [Methylocystis iwaonis]|uniref:Uncharacterized protein n=1 Tax=Methylocystis iwaonis TaxID=2885079 RepID=A0ABM8E550_9HYPH|nr:hypothetical protein [Methylocystis iwaonis]BDV33087.1 hypothetical protein SS37A_06160 [Methylocystis iwaonis]